MNRRCALATAIVVVAPLVASGAAPRWEAIFAADGAPPVHARVRYVDARGGEHRLELWRTGKALRRDTDDKLTVVVERRAHGGDELHVVERDGNRAYDVSRDALVRMGNFTSWAQLATLLTRPSGDVRVTAGASAKMASGVCRWYEAATTSQSQRICWSEALRLPLVVERAVGGRWSRVVTIDSAERARIPAATFAVDTQVARVDIDRDLD